MDTSHDYVLAPRPAALPALLASLRARLARLGHSIWRGLEALGRSRARQELRSLALLYGSTRPDLAQRLRDLGE